MKGQIDGVPSGREKLTAGAAMVNPEVNEATTVPPHNKAMAMNNCQALM
jgi:hypothetical protein